MLFQLAAPINQSTMTNIAMGSYHFYEFNNLVPGQIYAVYFSVNGANFRPLFLQQQGYPTQNNCPDSITMRNPNVYMSALTAQSQFLNFGLTAPDIVNYAMSVYPTRNDMLIFNMVTNQITVNPTQYTFFTYPLVNGQVPPGSALRVTSNVGVTIITSTAPFPSQFDTNPAPTNVMPFNGADVPIAATDRMGAIFNPGGNVAAQVTVMMVNGGQTTTATTGTIPVTPPAILPTQNVVLGLSLPAIIGIAAGGAVLIAGVIVGVWVYSKRRRTRRQREENQYKPVPNKTEGNKDTEKREKRKEKPKERPREEEISSTPSDSDSDSETDSSEENDGDEYDSYPPPRRSSRYSGRRPSRGPPRRGPSRSDTRRNRERSYSDDEDDDDDYSSDDYS
jgi:hypothetical protein